ncbi:MAG: hypothetical protein WBA25_16175 [Jannaschia sp.]
MSILDGASGRMAEARAEVKVGLRVDIWRPGDDAMPVSEIAMTMFAGSSGSKDGVGLLQTVTL